MTRTLDDDDPEEEFDAGEVAEYHPEQDEAGELWCPKCGAVIHADATLCPSCDNFVTPGAKPRASLPVWMWVGGGLLVLALLALLALR